MFGDIKPYYYCPYCSESSTLVHHDTVACPRRIRGDFARGPVPKAARNIEMIAKWTWMAKIAVSLALPVWFFSLSSVVLWNYSRALGVS